MRSYCSYIGIDPAAKTFAAGIYSAPSEPIHSCDGFENSIDGFQALCKWMQNNQLHIDETLICIEATGVYSEALCYYLYQNNYSVWLESPDKVKRAFKPKGHKTDPVDASQIAEYAGRYSDRCRLWKPKSHILEQLNTLLSVRELLVEQKTATSNALKAHQRKIVQTPMAIATLQANIQTLTQQIEESETEIIRLIKTNPQYHQLYHHFDSVPGVALLAAANLLVVTNGGQELTEYPKLSAYLGMAPYQHRSGTSVRKKSRSSQLGPQRLRKLLHLAARSLAHRSKHKHFREYYQRKLAQGKPPLLIYNNIANKILRIICALSREHKAYDKNYISINPNF